MANQTRQLGLHLSIGPSALVQSTAPAKEAEELGYTSLWMAEVSGGDAFLTLGACARDTSKAALATGVVPIQIRTPGVMAMSYLTLNELSHGRGIAGLGVSSPVIVDRWHGGAYRKPVTAMRECVAIMRQLFTDGRAKFDGEIYRADFRLGMRLTQKPPRIFLAALNPPMLRLAGAVADGVLMNFTPPDAIAAMIAEIRRGESDAGRSPGSVEIGIYIRMCVTPDESKAVDSFKRELAGYAFVDTYVKMFTKYGLGDELAEVRRLWREGKRDEAPKTISDASARKIAAFGSADSCRDFVARFRAAGVTHPVVFPIGPAATASRDFFATMRSMSNA